MAIEDSIREQLVILARRSNARFTQWTRGAPTEWNPGTVRNPEGGFFPMFTEDAAWEFIASKLENGHEVEMIELKQPPGKTGYVMKIDVGSDVPSLYVKLQLGSGTIIGRSFHYSKAEGESDE